MSESDIIKNFLDKIREILDKNQCDINFNLIEKACEIAKKAHTGQYRKYSGEPYLTHPLSVAIMLAKKYCDKNLTLAAILHDTVEDDDNTSMEYVYKTFGDEIGFIIDTVTDNIDHFYCEPEIKFDDKIEKLLYGGMKDIRGILLKLADRNHNLITLEWLKPNKQIRMTFETQAIYEPMKEILNCNSDGDIKYREELLNKYIKKNNIRSAKWLKDLLYNKTFHNFDNETFNLVYNNTQSVIWKIEDKEMYKNLIEMTDFDEKIEVISLDMYYDWKFECTFKYKKWQLFTEVNSKLKIQDNEFNN